MILDAVMPMTNKSAVTLSSPVLPQCVFCFLKPLEISQIKTLCRPPLNYILSW